MLNLAVDSWSQDYSQINWPLPKMFGKEKYGYSNWAAVKESDMESWMWGPERGEWMTWMLNLLRKAIQATFQMAIRFWVPSKNTLFFVVEFKGNTKC